jgi:hypothetical protein
VVASKISRYSIASSPRASFGLMDAGMDLAVLRYFGDTLMENIQKLILSDYLGEQPVGTCLLVRAHHVTHPYVAHAPTMRVPMNIQGTDHVYLALWAVLTAVHRRNRSELLALRHWPAPGLAGERAVWISKRLHYKCIWLTFIPLARRSI